MQQNKQFLADLGKKVKILKCQLLKGYSTDVYEQNRIE